MSANNNPRSLNGFSLNLIFGSFIEDFKDNSNFNGAKVRGVIWRFM
jgi:hypothetical protein